MRVLVVIFHKLILFSNRVEYFNHQASKNLSQRFNKAYTEIHE
jgi:hypothetical protein